MKKVVRGETYDDSDLESILLYAKTIEGRTLREALDIPQDLKPKGYTKPKVEGKQGNKGAMGDNVEEYFFDIFAEHDAPEWNLEDRLMSSGVMARAFPIVASDKNVEYDFTISDDPYEVTKHFGVGDSVSKFQNAGVMQYGHVLTRRVDAVYDGTRQTLGEILVPAEQVPEAFWIDDAKLPSWQYLKGGKREERISRTGYSYTYSEGPVAFPDPLNQPSRTILTGEGGSGASRTKHVVEQNGRLRRLVPDELDALQEFPVGWTGDGLMSDGHRAFCMGNALVTGIPHRIGSVLAQDVA